MTAALALGVFLAATAGAPDIAVACLTLLATGAAAFSFVTLCSTTLQLHSSPAYRHLQTASLAAIAALTVHPISAGGPAWLSAGSFP